MNDTKSPSYGIKTLRSKGKRIKEKTIWSIRKYRKPRKCFSCEKELTEYFWGDWEKWYNLTGRRWINFLEQHPDIDRAENACECGKCDFKVLSNI
jgi:hypothetical protein